jgi:hypothetical protein
MLAHRASGRPPDALATGAGSFTRLLGRPPALTYDHECHQHGHDSPTHSGSKRNGDTYCNSDEAGEKRSGDARQGGRTEKGP